MENRYTIGQLSQLCGLSVHTLRFYEKEGLLHGIERLGSGRYRVYEERDLAWLQLIARLRETGMPLRLLKQLAEWRGRGDGTLADRREVLEQHRAVVHRQLEELQRHIAQLDRHIELYQALESGAVVQPDGSGDTDAGTSGGAGGGDAGAGEGEGRGGGAGDGVGADVGDGEGRGTEGGVGVAGIGADVGGESAGASRVASADGRTGADESAEGGSRPGKLVGWNEGEALQAYYALRADHYERIYHRDDPVRQQELHAIEAELRRALSARSVLEIACGTGFWTRKAAQAAERITATDAAPETLRLARAQAAVQERAAAESFLPRESRLARDSSGRGGLHGGGAVGPALSAEDGGDAGKPPERATLASESRALSDAGGARDASSVPGLGRVTFLEGDAYRLQEVPGEFDAALAMFWLSHVPKRKIPSFLDGLHRRVGPGSVVFMADNVYVPGIGGKLIVRPEEADTYKLRELADGSEHEIVKNYFTERELAGIFGPISSELRITVGECFWWLTYKVQ